MNPRAWARTNIIDTTTAAARCGVSPQQVRKACADGRIQGAWKPSIDSRVWLMAYGDVVAWRRSIRVYTRLEKENGDGR